MATKISKYPQFYSQKWPTKTATKSWFLFVFLVSSFSIYLSFSPCFSLFPAVSWHLSWNPKTAHQMRLQAYIYIYIFLSLSLHLSDSLSPSLSLYLSRSLVQYFQFLFILFLSFSLSLFHILILLFILTIFLIIFLILFSVLFLMRFLILLPHRLDMKENAWPVTTTLANMLRQYWLQMILLAVLCQICWQFGQLCCWLRFDPEIPYQDWLGQTHVFLVPRRLFQETHTAPVLMPVLLT